MSFKAWLHMWIRSFWRVLNVTDPPVKSEEERKKERERRLKRKHSAIDRYKPKRERKPPTHPNLRLAGAALQWFATTLAVIFVPLGLFHFGYKKARERVAARRGSRFAKFSSAGNSTACKSRTVSGKNTEAKEEKPQISADDLDVKRKKRERLEINRGVRADAKYAVDTRLKNEDGEEVCNSNKAESATNAHRRQTAGCEDLDTSLTSAPSSIAANATDGSNAALTEEKQEQKKREASVPVSSPICERDQYIRKRMSFSPRLTVGEELLSELIEGEVLDLTDTGDGNNSVGIMYKGLSVGYVREEDRAPISVCLKLGRKIYGIIVDKRNEDGIAVYEYEAWFRS